MTFQINSQKKFILNAWWIEIPLIFCPLFGKVKFGSISHCVIECNEYIYHLSPQTCRYPHHFHCKMMNYYCIHLPKHGHNREISCLENYSLVQLSKSHVYHLGRSLERPEIRASIDFIMETIIRSIQCVRLSIDCMNVTSNFIASKWNCC